MLNELIKAEITKDVPTYYKENTLLLYEKYRHSDNLVTNIPLSKIVLGRFYHIIYEDDNNWLKYSPIFCVSFKRVNNLFILIGINMNLIPLEVRVYFFDGILSEKDIINDEAIDVDYAAVYNRLSRYGFEYSLMEYNMLYINTIHQINLSILPKFLYSSYPINKYEPKKLYNIWKTKQKTKAKRESEMIRLTMDSFLKTSEEISDSYDVLKEHIARFKK